MSTNGHTAQPGTGYNPAVHGLPQARPAEHRRKARGRADAVDIHVGGRVRLRRQLLNMSQEQLGEAVGLTFQQIQKYERGANRIGSGRLWQFATILGVTVGYFYEGLAADGSPSVAADRLDREALTVAAAYRRIPGKEERRAVRHLVDTLSVSVAAPAEGAPVDAAGDA